MIGTIGNPVVVDTNRIFSIKNVALFKFKDNKELINIFLKRILESEYMKKRLLIKTRGGTQQFISLANLRNFKNSSSFSEDTKRDCSQN